MGKFDGIMIVCDCDGTLLNAQREIPERNIDAIRHFTGNGGKFVIATGRPKNGALHILEKLPSSSPSVFFNGALIYDTHTETTLHADVVDVDTTEVMEQICSRFPAEVGVEAFTVDEAFAVQDHPVTRYHFEILHEPFRLVEPKDVPVGGVLKLFVTGKYDDIKAVQAYLQELYPGALNVVPSGKEFLEIFSPRSNKGEALAVLRQKFPEIHTFCAVGDGYNDMPMLETADRTFVPANGVDAAKACGVTVCSCDEGALADVIRILENEA